MPPGRLVSFRFDEWEALAPAFHEQVDRPESDADERERRVLRAFHTFCEAQDRWAAEHGWPVDSLDFLRDRVAQLLAVLPGVASVGPGPALAGLLAQWG